MKKEICQEQLKQNKIIGFNDGNVMFKIEELKNTKEVIIPSSEGDYLEYKHNPNSIDGTNSYAIP